jgi:hypothetical protein
MISNVSAAESAAGQAAVVIVVAVLVVMLRTRPALAPEVQRTR